MSLQPTLVYVYVVIISAICIICGCIIIHFVYQFKSYTNTRFLKLRKPSLILLYSYASIFSLFVLCPTHMYLELARLDFFWIWLLHLIQELTVSCMLIIITARCWLLYYDHSYSVSLVDKNWKGAINKNDTNFWLKYRRTCGDFAFIFCVGIVLSVAVLMVLLAVSIPVLQHNDLTLLNATCLCIVAIPCYIMIFAIIIKNKIKKLHLYDEFMIIREVQYLSLSAILVIVIYILELIQIRADSFAIDIVAPGHILFCFLSSYFQTHWVVKQFQKKNQMMIRKKKTLKAPRNHPLLTMSDILRTKDGFTMFMRHCQAELNVEGLLFIVESAQYKAKLSDIMQENEPELEVSTRETTTSTRETKGSLDETMETSAIPPIATLHDLPRLKSMLSNETSDAGLVEFGGNILAREWMPISKQLFKPRKKNIAAEMMRMSEDLQVVILTDHEAEREEKEQNDVFQLENENNKMYEYAQYLFLKYVDVESDFMINISYDARKELLLFFSHNREKGYEFIMQNCGGYDMIDDNTSRSLFRSLIIKQYLYHLFDRTLSDVWKLLSSDTYLRFMQTKQYQYLIKNQKNQK